jgi:hypothetical protein
MSFQANTRSYAYTASTTLPVDTSREYLLISVQTGSVTVQLGNGSGLLPIGELGVFEPTVAPTSAISILAAPDSAYVVLTDGVV